MTAEKICPNCTTADWSCRGCNRKTCEHLCQNQTNNGMATCNGCIQAARQSRTRQGRYDYSTGWERRCRCGHELGVHTAVAPRDCIIGDFGHPRCDCKAFRLVKESVVDEFVSGILED